MYYLNVQGGIRYYVSRAVANLFAGCDASASQERGEAFSPIGAEGAGEARQPGPRAQAGPVT